MKPNATPENAWHISRATPADAAAVAQLWFGQTPPVEQLESLKTVLAGEHELLARWWLARQGEEVQGALLTLRQSGALATCWPPRAGVELSREATLALAQEMWQPARQELRESGVRLIQAVAPDLRSLEARLFRAMQFQHITQLLTMRWRFQHGASLRPGHAQVRFVAVEDQQEEEFRSTLEQTYVESLDAPELEHYQTSAEILAGQVQNNCQRWIVRTPAGNAVGVLVLSQEGTLGQLNYCGIIPQARRQRMGTDAVLWALQYFRGHYLRRVSVRLDGRNEPARRLYERSGFVLDSTEELFLCQ
jgi:RimJ/RimL family protein N-acetyltransferase